MELDKLVIEISADDAAFVRALNQNSKVLKDFGITGTATADQLTKALASIARESKKATDPEQVRKLSAVYNYLNERLAIVNENIRKYAIQVDESGRVIEPFGKKTKRGAEALTDAEEASRRARIAVYGLNQVVRDAPFGFIAISNNIPVLLDQFQELVVKKKSVTGAFKEFGGALLGAGGVSIAISGVISLITTAVQKYGSLSNAVAALTTNLGPLIERLNEANTQYQKFLKESLTLPDVRIAAGVASDSDIARLDNLIRGLRDENKTNQEKEQILKRIASQYGDIFQGYDLQKSSIQSVIAVLETYKQNIRDTQSEKGFNKQLDEANKALAEQKIVLSEVNSRLDAARKRQAAVSKQYFEAAARAEAGGVNPFANQYTEATFELNKLINEQKRLETQIRIAIMKQYEYGKAVDDTTNSSIASTAKAADIAAKTLVKQDNTRKSAQNKELKDNIAVLQAKLAQEKSYLTTLNSLNKDFEDQQIKIATLERDIKAAQLTKQISDRQELSEAIKAIDIDLQNEITRIVGEGVTRRVEYWKADGEAARQAAEETRKAFEAIPKVAPDATKIISGDEIKRFLAIVDGFRKEVTDREKQRIEDLLRLSNQYADSIANAAGSLVQGLLDGKKPLDVLVEGFKRLAIEIAVATARYFAFKALTKAFDVALPGSGQAINAGANALSNFRLFRTAAPSINPTTGFSIAGGGLQLQGSVVFTQRGSDLVGVLNNSNARINRVG